MSQQLLAEQWAEFSGRCLPLNASAVQRQEMRRAFYAGCQSMFSTVVSASDLPEETAIAVMTKLQRELDQFFFDISQGRA